MLTHVSVNPYLGKGQEILRATYSADQRDLVLAAEDYHS